MQKFVIIGYFYVCKPAEKMRKINMGNPINNTTISTTFSRVKFFTGFYCALITKKYHSQSNQLPKK